MRRLQARIARRLSAGLRSTVSTSTVASPMTRNRRDRPDAPAASPARRRSPSRLLDGRSSGAGSAGGVARRPAHRLRRGDDRPRREHDDAAACGWPARRRPGAAHRRPARRPAGVVARRALPRLHVAARREGQGDARCTCCRSAGPGEVRTVGDDARRHRRPARGRPTASGSRSPAAPATPATTPRTRAGSRRARSRRSSPGSTARAGSSTGPRTCTSCAADGTGAAAQPHARPVPARRRRRGSPTRPASSRRRRRHDGWDLDLAERPLRRPARRRDPRPHEADRDLRPTRRCRPTARRVAFLGADDPTTTRRTPRSASIAVDGGPHRVGLDGPRPHVRADRRRRGRRSGSTTTRCSPPPRIAARPTSTGSAADGSAAPEPLTTGPLSRAVVRRRRRARSPWPRPPSSTRPSSSRSTARSPDADASRGSGWEKFAVPTTDGTDEIDAWIMRPAGFDARRSVPGAAQRPRRPVHPVRRDVLRRGPDAGGGRVRRRDVQPARRQRPAHGVGAVDHRAEAPDGAGHRLGQRRRRRRARRARRTPSTATRSATATGSACSAAATAATWPRCSPAGTATASGRSAASGPSTTCSPRSVSSDIGTVFRTSTGVDHLDDPDEYVRDVADPPRPRHRRADADHPLRERPALPDQPGRGAVRRAAPARQGRDVLPLPRREPRAVPLRLAGAPPDARRDHPRLLHREAAAPPQVPRKR